MTKKMTKKIENDKVVLMDQVVASALACYCHQFDSFDRFQLNEN